MHIFISTGEVSGDLQGSLLVEALFRQAEALNIDLKITALGGDRMAAAGATLLGNTTKIGSIGLIESLPYIIPTLRIQRQAKRYLKENPPDLVVLIDYIGPNIGIGNFVRRQLPQVPIIYYIAPQAWVWSFNDNNTKAIARITDRILAIFPEEARYFAEYGIDVKFVGHPLVAKMATCPRRATAREKLGLNQDRPLITLLPASRRQELKYLLPVMVEAAKILQRQVPEVKFLIPVALPHYRNILETAVNEAGLNAILIDNPAQTPLAIAAADLAITKSGTVNLEIALLDVPQVVLYKVHPVTAWIAKHLLKFSIPFMCPVNLTLMRRIVPELLQTEATAPRIAQESLALLQDGDRQAQLQQDYQEMRAVMGDGKACDVAAVDILTFPSHGR
ncbi:MULTISPECIES: lipid-A-disaccharide synthase [unclassified Picosynechococcus]|uniref:lipid-A-disaccharide synthase n=1 Tax=unclassified Picosynechococcus TaxID=3079910 RepID=UPI0007457DCA|nr:MULTISPECIES: lipid-A-disaccharide synthase [unclassified Picosynechococcus]AMA07895.1 lipid-A-disaccharide synthase [Picosynechococcus sp. PCC 73109]QCS48734.1 lipid-A-disaccharide synthase [Picosynechococcus sp. PCC 11901]